MIYASSIILRRCLLSTSSRHRSATMAKGNKQNRTAQGSDGKRKETREERRARLQAQDEAKEVSSEQGGGQLFCLLLWSRWIVSIPSRSHTHHRNAGP